MISLNKREKTYLLVDKSEESGIYLSIKERKKWYLLANKGEKEVVFTCQ